MTKTNKTNRALIRKLALENGFTLKGNDVVQPSSGPKTLTTQQKQKILDHINKTITDGGAVYHRTIIDLTEWALLSENGFTELTWVEWVRQDRHQ